MIRLIKQLFEPAAAKCERLGHKTRPVEVDIWQVGQGGTVLYDCVAVIDKCRRCGHESEPRDVERLDWFNAWTLPMKTARQLQAKGWARR